jgi:hypothetical protein
MPTIQSLPKDVIRLIMIGFLPRCDGLALAQTCSTFYRYLKRNERAAWSLADPQTRRLRLTKAAADIDKILQAVRAADPDIEMTLNKTIKIDDKICWSCALPKDYFHGSSIPCPYVTSKSVYLTLRYSL